ILARRLVFEGGEILIKGPHNIYVYVIEPEEISTVSQDSSTRKRNPRFAKAGFSPAVVSLPKKDININIDVSALSYKEWLEQQATARAARTTRGGKHFKAWSYSAHSYPQTP